MCIYECVSISIIVNCSFVPGSAVMIFFVCFGENGKTDNSPFGTINGVTLLHNVYRGPGVAINSRSSKTSG